MRLCSIASGSSGNCIYVGTDNTHLLVDDGISKKRVEEGLNSLDLTLTDIDGILITHEHSDHISGLGVLLRKAQIPVYATAKTIAKILSAKPLERIENGNFIEIREDEPFAINDIEVAPMSIMHDAANPVAYRFKNSGKRIGVVTDLGAYTDYTVENLRGLDGILIEANHDKRMLETGPYPYYLKRRISGDLGHLSNEMSGKLLSQILSDRMSAIILGHLSAHNNMAELALETVKEEITTADIPFRGSDFPIMVARRSEPSPAVVV